MIFRYIFVIGLTLIATACSSSARKSQSGPLEILSTTILANGTKMFVFTLEEVQVERGLDAANSLAPGNNDRPKGEAVIGGYLGERLAAILKKTGYCREGFMEFDRNIAKDVSIIRGECYEPATDEDRKNFING